jgi:signal transduction histidine kinase
MGYFAHELRNLLGTASLAFAATKAGNLSLGGATGSILERSLAGLDKLIAASLDDVRALGKADVILGSFSLAAFIAEIYNAALLSAKMHDCTLRVPEFDPELALAGNRDVLIAAVANLLQNAFKFTQPGTDVLLTAYAAGDNIHIDVQDHCGGLGDGVAQGMFVPFAQSGQDRSGMGLGLTIARQSVAANGGELTVRNLPHQGCVFTIALPRHSMPT